MSERGDKDRMERGPTPGVSMAPPTPTTLPTVEPEDRSLQDQRADLVHMIDEIEGTLRYMGGAHPQRRATEQRLASLTQMLVQIDAALRARR